MVATLFISGSQSSFQLTLFDFLFWQIANPTYTHIRRNHVSRAPCLPRPPLLPRLYSISATPHPTHSNWSKNLSLTWISSTYDMLLCYQTHLFPPLESHDSSILLDSKLPRAGFILISQVPAHGRYLVSTCSMNEWGKETVWYSLSLYKNSWTYHFKNPFTNLEQEKNKVGLGHPVPRSKEAFIDQWDLSEGQRSHQDEVPFGQIWDNISNLRRIILIDYSILNK